MVCGALARAARQQGQRRLLAWRQALAEVQAAPEQRQQIGQWQPRSGVVALLMRLTFWRTMCSFRLKRMYAGV
jgi:hypothetical protein